MTIICSSLNGRTCIVNFSQYSNIFNPWTHIYLKLVYPNKKLKLDNYFDNYIVILNEGILLLIICLNHISRFVLKQWLVNIYSSRVNSVVIEREKRSWTDFDLFFVLNSGLQKITVDTKSLPIFKTVIGRANWGFVLTGLDRSEYLNCLSNSLESKQI